MPLKPWSGHLSLPPPGRQARGASLNCSESSRPRLRIASSADGALLGPFHDLDRHFEVNETRLQQRQRELVHCIDPQAVVSGVSALMKFQTRPACRSNLGTDIDTPEQAVRFGTGTIHKLPAVPPVAFTHRLVVVARPNEVVLPYRFRILFSLVRNALADEELAPCRFR